MANSNSISGGWYNLPAQANPGTTGEFVFVVPAAGLYSLLPSPQQLAGNDLVLAADTQGVSTNQQVAGGSFVAHPFTIKVAGLIANHTTQNWVVKIYQVPASTIAGWTSSTGSSVVGGTALCTATAASVVGGSTTKSNFNLSVQCMYDNTSKILNAQLGIGQVGGIAASTIGTLAAATAVDLGDLNFIVSFTLASGTAADKVSLTDFVIGQV